MKNRRLTVSYMFIKGKEVPIIRLSGDWLKALGFDSGQKIIVREQPGELVIRIAEEVATYEN